MKHLTLPNNIETISQLNAFVDTLCEEWSIDMDLAMSLNLAIEEAVVNVMDYAYPEGTVGYVDIEADIDDTYITFVLSDSGMPFDPTQKEEVDTTLPAEQRKIGGLGIHIMRQNMDSINYERINDLNVLTLRKNIIHNH